MEKFKGTKGKWEVEKHPDSKTIFYINNRYFIKGNIATCYSISDTNESESNAQLISCAPEMLEMLIKLSYDFEDEELEQLIKKATCTD